MKRRDFVAAVVLTGAIFGAIARGYEVSNSENQGFKVTAEDYVYITTPDGQKLQITDNPFVGDGYSLPPIGPVICSWAPNRKWVGIFIFADKGTAIYVFDLTRKKLLMAQRDWKQYPSWFGQPQLFDQDKPVSWSGNKLSVDSLIKFRNGTARHLPQEVVVDGDTYQIVPQTEKEHKRSP